MSHEALMRDPSKHYITTYSGLSVYPLSPTPETISIIDIAHQSSCDARFSGATRDFYSVAQHQVVASMVAEAWFGAGCIEAKQSLLHDATEAYLRDIPAGVKHLPQLAGYRDIEDGLAQCIFGRFDVEWPMSPSIKLIDKKLAATEAVSLLLTKPDWLGVGDYEPILGLEIFPLPPKAAEAAFLRRFQDLFGPINA